MGIWNKVVYEEEAEFFKFWRRNINHGAKCDYATLILWVVYAGSLMEAAGSLEELLSRMEPLIAYCNNRNKKEN